MGKKVGRVSAYVKTGPGHDRRYAIDAGKMQRELGGGRRIRLKKPSGDDPLVPENEKWWRAIKTGEYLSTTTPCTESAAEKRAAWLTPRRTQP